MEENGQIVRRYAWNSQCTWGDLTAEQWTVDGKLPLDSGK
jgi:hypothetical protein